MIWIIAGVILGVGVVYSYGSKPSFSSVFFACMAGALMGFFISIIIGSQILVSEDNCIIKEDKYTLYKDSNGEYINISPEGTITVRISPSGDVLTDKIPTNNRYYVSYTNPCYVKYTYGAFKGIYFFLGIHISETFDKYYIDKQYIHLLS